MEGRPYRPELLLQPEDVASVIASALGRPRTDEETHISSTPMNSQQVDVLGLGLRGLGKSASMRNRSIASLSEPELIGLAAPPCSCAGGTRGHRGRKPGSHRFRDQLPQQ